MKTYKTDTSFFDKIPSQLQLDEMVSEYVRLNNGKKPKFILMDEMTRSAFTKIAHAKERIKLADEPPKEDYKITHFATTEGGVLEILTVQKDPSLVEVVG